MNIDTATPRPEQERARPGTVSQEALAAAQKAFPYAALTADLELAILAANAVDFAARERAMQEAARMKEWIYKLASYDCGRGELYDDNEKLLPLEKVFELYARCRQETANSHRKAMQGLEARVKELEGDLLCFTETKAHFNRLMEHNISIKGQLDQQTLRAETLEAEVKELQADCDESDVIINGLNRQVEALKDACDLMREQRDRLQEEVAGLIRDKQALRDLFDANPSALYSQVETLTQQLADQRGEMEQLRKDKQAFRELFDANPSALYSQVESQRGEIERLQAENEKLSANQIPQGWICHP